MCGMWTNFVNKIENLSFKVVKNDVHNHLGDTNAKFETKFDTLYISYESFNFSVLNIHSSLELHSREHELGK